jgi:hypothetical protein
MTETLQQNAIPHMWTWNIPHLEEDARAHRRTIVEFPKPLCVASAFKRDKIASARQKFINNCGSDSSSSWLKLAGSVTIVGVGFWVERHGQTGIAPNGIELHPVSNFFGDCHKASTGGGGGGGGVSVRVRVAWIVLS